MGSTAKAIGSYKTWELDLRGQGEVEMGEREGGSRVGMWGVQELANKEHGGPQPSLV